MSDLDMKLNEESPVFNPLIFLGIGFAVLLFGFLIVWFIRKRKSLSRGKASATASGEYQGLRYYSV
jgi:hypothetical protein